MTSTATTSPLKCCKVKISGLPCTNDATYTLDGKPFCGVHIDKKRKDQAEAIDKVKSRSTVSAAVTLLAVCDELDQAITRRITANDLGDNIADDGVERPPTIDPRITKLATMPQEHRRIIIRRATELSGSQDNVSLVIASLPTAVSDFLRAFNEKRLKMTYKSPYISTLQNCEANRVNRKSPSSSWLEDGNTVRFSDVDMIVANCSKPYLDALEMRSIDEMCEEGDVIYMGPKGAIISPIGVEIPANDSEWYIPLPSTCRLRTTHNIIKAQEILQAIKDGDDTADKYLALQGKVLACVCLPYPCHCMVYVEVVRSLLSANIRQAVAMANINVEDIETTTPEEVSSPTTVEASTPLTMAGQCDVSEAQSPMMNNTCEKTDNVVEEVSPSMPELEEASPGMPELVASNVEEDEVMLPVIDTVPPLVKLV